MDTLMSFRLPSDLVRRIDAIAESDRRSRAFIVREALEHFLPELENPKPPKAKSQRKKANGVEAGK
jgi:predicted transcriptional regulator